jgi:hypothetical protein
LQLGEAEGVGDAGLEEGAEGECVAGPWPEGEDESVAVRELLGRLDAELALALAECEAVAEALAVGRCEAVAPKAGVVAAGSPAEGFCIAAAGEPAAGDGVETSTSAPRPPTLTSPAAASVSTRLRRLR